MLRLVAGIAGLGLLALPVLAQVRSRGDENSAIMADNEAMDAAGAATQAAMRAAANATVMDNTAAIDTTYDANADMSMDTNMAYALPSYRFYRVGTGGPPQRQISIYMDANSVRHISNAVRGWETRFLNYQEEHFRPGARMLRSLVEANCQQQQLRYLTSIFYTRSGDVLNTVDEPYPDWVYVAPDTLAESIYQFLCEDNRAFPGTFDVEADARRTLPPERAARPIMTLPQQLRPGPRHR